MPAVGGYARDGASVHTTSGEAAALLRSQLHQVQQLLDEQIAAAIERTRSYRHVAARSGRCMHTRCASRTVPSTFWRVALQRSGNGVGAEMTKCHDSRC